MKKILIIGASILQLPAIRKAKALGYYVGVLDYNPNAIGIPFADEYYNVSTNDIEGVTQTAEAFKPDGIMTLATDMPMRSIATACAKLGLSGISIETAIKSTDKAEMIKAFEEHGVSHPWFFISNNKTEFNKIRSRLSYPCIIKPTDNAGSRGVVLVNNPNELDSGYAYSKSQSRSGAVIIEEQLIGPEVSVEIIIYNGIPHILQITDKITTGAPHFVEMGHTQPSRLPNDIINEIKQLACQAVLSVGIENGPAHVEIISTKDGPKMVELGARMGGDCITTHLVPLSTGIDMIKATIDIACNKEPDLEAKISQGSAIRFFDIPSGTITKIQGIETVKQMAGVKEVCITKKVGDDVNTVDSSIDRVGFVITQGSNADEAEMLCEKAVSMVNISIGDK